MIGLICYIFHQLSQKGAKPVTIKYISRIVALHNQLKRIAPHTELKRKKGMACSSISLLVFLLVASYASATSIQELCKGNPDADYCAALLKSSVPQSSDFKSEEWRKKLVNYVLQKAVAAEKVLVDESHKLKRSDAAALKTCVKSFGDSVKKIKEGDLDMAAANQDDCSDSVENSNFQIGGTTVKTLANEASRATKMAYRILN